ncbi:prephenate dehydrogenase (plasmid) [Streptomyces sp. ADI95-16]|uniref:prephenate dehydrogenase/arogenate dehydrogenase family protein n=1 Tax=unclassified Streptomyces TaxID=2593676 RepID=UPI000F3AA68C|nr:MULTISPECIES: prephenate dehydrogenase/arogenate dehydrogenase family protein [unclassified Streptomyces]AYV33064.1 prephenate dehydrogenase [Streptomyces sp. ADI95-16]RPK24617.1 prephenate dehydrogenase [Streptomyces sp. ADI91-18]
MTDTTLRTAVIIGCGATGTSVALALTAAGVDVALIDRDPRATAEAAALGGGRPWSPARPPADLVVVATPPSSVVDILHTAQARGMGHVYTDTAGTKDIVSADAELRGCDLKGYVPGHPMADSDAPGRNGADAGRFDGRPWILCPYESTPDWALDTVGALIELCGAVRRDMAPDAHDRAVAVVSHAPYLSQAAVAAEFADAGADLSALVGPELLTGIRAAGADPATGSDLLTHNAGPVADALDRIADRIAAVARILHEGAETAPVELAALLELGARGHRAVAGVPGHSTTEDAPRPDPA